AVGDSLLVFVTPDFHAAGVRAPCFGIPRRVCRDTSTGRRTTMPPVAAVRWPGFRLGFGAHRTAPATGEGRRGSAPPLGAGVRGSEPRVCGWPPAVGESGAGAGVGPAAGPVGVGGSGPVAAPPAGTHDRAPAAAVPRRDLRDARPPGPGRAVRRRGP